jgi:hypothetical protein
MLPVIKAPVIYSFSNALLHYRTLPVATNYVEFPLLPVTTPHFEILVK